jgi:hypothetical protein
MVKHGILILFIIVLLLPFTSVKAECSLSQVSRLTKIANNVNITYVFDENDKATYDITITNLTKEIYLLDTTNNKKYSYSSKNKEIVISNVPNGTTLKFSIYAVDRKCYTEKLVSKTISLPAYNPYYKNPLCQEASAHPLCQRFTKTSVTEEEFKKIIDEYLKKSDEEPEEPINENIWWNLFIEYYWVLYGFIIIAGATGMIIYHNRNKLF